jgi:pimeloyl-ACP methyl ester carboxylesterase
MTVDDALRDVRLPAGTVRYRDTGSGPTLLFVHGLLVNGTLWRKVVPELSGSFRCVVPDLPLGSHSVPMEAGADLTPPGLARLIADLMEELDLRDVTLVGNDTGGALCQIVAAHHPERLAGLVLTPCDAYENFLPPMFRPLQLIARVPGAIGAALQGARSAAVRRSPLAYGVLTKRPIPDDVTEGWVRPALASRGVRRDVEKVLRGIHPRYTLEAARRLASFEHPALVAWAPKDRFFPFAHAELLAATIPNARLERVPDSKTFVPEDRPERLAELISSFVGARDQAASRSAAAAK